MRRAKIITVFVLSGFLLGACGFSTESDSGESGEPGTEGVTLYSGRIAAAIGGAVDDYEASSDTDVQVRFADTGDLAATLVEEGSNSPADVFFAQEPGAIGAVKRAGLLAELPRDIVNSVPAEYRDPDGGWVGVTGRARTVAYGESIDEADLPESPLDFVDPEWEGRIGWSAVSDSLQQYVTALRLEFGEDVAREWVEGMVANDVVDFPNNVAIRDAVASGEIDAGLINHYYVAQAIAAEGPNYPVELYFPPDGIGSLLLVTSVGVLDSSDRKEEAFDFVRSLLAREGQDFFTSTSKEYPLAKGATPDESLEVPLADIPVPTGSLSDITETQATIELLEDAGAL